MKRHLIILLFAITACLKVMGQQRTKITGTFIDSKDSVMTLTLAIFNPLDLESGGPTIETKTFHGNFEFAIDLEKPTFVSIRTSKAFLAFSPLNEFLIEPGDSIHFDIPHALKMPLEELEITGRNVRKFDLMKKVLLPELNFARRQKLWNQQSISEKIDMCVSEFHLIDSALKANNRLVKPEIEARIKAQATYDIFNLLFLHCTRRDTIDLAYKKYFTDQIISSKIMEFCMKDSLAYNLEGKNILNDYAKIVYSFKHDQKVNPSFRLKDPVGYYRLITECYSGYPITKYLVLSDFMMSYMKHQGYTKELLELANLYNKEPVLNKNIKNQVDKRIIMTKQNLKKGAPFFNFSLEDASGKSVTLASLSGKVLVIDFWFTGCGACRQTTPIMEELEKTFDKKEVLFISISIDKRKTEWESGRGLYSSKSSLQLYTNGDGTNHPLIDYADIKAYPTLLVLDKEGKYVGRCPNPRTEKDATIKFISEAINGR